MKSSTLDAYYRMELLYSLVQQILHVTDEDGAATSQDATSIQIADLLMAVAHVDRMLCANPSAINSDSTQMSSSSEMDADDDKRDGLLGVTPAMLHQTTGLTDDRVTRFHRDAARHALLPRVEDALREKCNDLCEVLLPELLHRTTSSTSTASAASSSPSSTVATASHTRQVMEIPALIVELQSIKLQKTRTVAQLQRQLHTQLREDLQRLQVMIHGVQRLLRQYKQEEAPRVLHAKMQWLSAYSRAMALRARVLTKQIQAETYPREQAALLRRLYEALQERRQRALDSHEQLLAKLHLYRSGDAEYQAIVREYSFVVQSIEEKKKWIQSLNM